MSTASTRRCAIYTRKSSEEGLEQDFNSLHAQREACEAYIRSQKHEGWRLIETAYDDGGVSGGTMERPGLQRLLEDIRADRVDVIVVYKVDRLTRSLADFAKMVEIFDGHGVSFVAVTQQFNTTTSMGRLTLNVLLSFAQFEREVTGERIRDKIAASKKKGMWMGGYVPLGYDLRDRKLIVNPGEAETIHLIFHRYATLGSVRLLKEELDRQAIGSKKRVSPNGDTSGGGRFSRGALYAILKNPIYVGEIGHRGARHPGQHEAIVDRRLWDQVQQWLGEGESPRRPRQVGAAPLAGKLWDEQGDRLTVSHTSKGGRRYRYYVSRSLATGTAAASKQGWRLPAREIEQAVAIAAAQMLANHGALAASLTDAQGPGGQLRAALATAAGAREKLLSETERNSVLTAITDRVELRHEEMTVSLSLQPLLSGPRKVPDTASPVMTESLPLQMRRRGQEMRLVIEGTSRMTGKPDSALLKIVARARRWFEEVASGEAESLVEIAKREGVTDRYIGQLLPLAFLAPDIVGMIGSGLQPPHFTAKRLIAHAARLSLDWNEQARILR